MMAKIVGRGFRDAFVKKARRVLIDLRGVDRTFPEVND